MADLPPGIYEQLISIGLGRDLESIDSELIHRGPLDPVDAHEILSRHLARLARRALQAVGGDDSTALIRQIEMTNRIAEAIRAVAPNVANEDDLVAESRDLLYALLHERSGPGPVRFPARPEVPLSATALLVNGRNQPRIGTEIQRELASADSVDLLCAFVKWHGLRVIDEHIEALIRRGGRLHVITTTYIGATEQRAIDRLAELGAEIRVSYETRMTRLHAKAWLFHRSTGFSTAYVGSSNLSKAALLDGLEWNVRLSAVEQGHLLDTFEATFDEYWEDPAFEPYDPADAAQRERLAQALAVERTGPTDLPIELTALEVRPWGYQQEILDELTAEREVHGSWRNLVVGHGNQHGQNDRRRVGLPAVTRRWSYRLGALRCAPRRDPDSESGDLPPHHAKRFLRRTFRGRRTASGMAARLRLRSVPSSAGSPEGSGRRSLRHGHRR